MRDRKKSDLPRKICVTCGKLFTWRKKWALDWPDVKYCSDKCRRKSDTSLPRRDAGAV
ncbi:MAG: DUF2256 domain-containing protein [Planctomycetes bacterium]|nr:DUF2256 domain-containing protein [Planctomycetota bacterium]